MKNEKEKIKSPHKKIIKKSSSAARVSKSSSSALKKTVKKASVSAKPEKTAVKNVVKKKAVAKKSAAVKKVVKKKVVAKKSAAVKKVVAKKSVAVKKVVKKKIVKKAVKTVEKIKEIEVAEPVIVISPVQPLYEDTAPLPFSYDVTRLVAIVRDPLWLYLYWDFNHDAEKMISKVFSSQHGVCAVVRSFDVTNIEFNGNNSHSMWDVQVDIHSRSWYMNVSSPGKSYIFELGLIDANGTYTSIVRSNTITMPSDGPSDVVDERWVSADFTFDEIYEASGGGFLHRVQVGDSEFMYRRGEGVEWLSSGALVSHGFHHAQEVSQKDFFLKVETELIVRGATKPNADVRVQGKKIALRPDGTFSLRFILPDGMQRIPIKAVSSCATMQEQVTIDVTKGTH